MKIDNTVEVVDYDDHDAVKDVWWNGFGLDILEVAMFLKKVMGRSLHVQNVTGPLYVVPIALVRGAALQQLVGDRHAIVRRAEIRGNLSVDDHEAMLSAELIDTTILWGKVCLPKYLPLVGRTVASVRYDEWLKLTLLGDK